MNISNAFIIFSGFNQRAIIAFCRFAEERNIKYFIIAKSDKDPILNTTYSNNIVHIRKSANLDIEDLLSTFELIKNKKKIHNLIILPSTEALNRFVLLHKNVLLQHGIQVPLVDQDLYFKISNKYSFGELCRSYDIPVPRELPTYESMAFPYVAKPKQYSSTINGKQLKPWIITDLILLQRFLSEENINDFYFQDFIDGKSYYLLFYFSIKGQYSVFSQENLIQQFNGRSIVAAKSSLIHEHQIASIIANLFLQNNFYGLVMVEIKHFNNMFYMIEANPRLWGPSQLILDSGMDLFSRFAEDYFDGIKNKIYSYKHNIKYYWSGGIIEDQKKSHTVTFYNYNEKLFFSEYAEWCNADVYLKPDTNTIYLKELYGQE